MKMLNTIKTKIPSIKEGKDLLIIKFVLFTYYGGAFREAQKQRKARAKVVSRTCWSMRVSQLLLMFISTFVQVFERNFTCGTQEIMAQHSLLLSLITINVSITLILHTSMTCVFPYLAVHMRQIGISIQNTAFIHAMLPVFMLIGPPVLGFIADKHGGYKILLIISLVLNGTFHTSLLWVPQAHVGTNLDNVESMLCENASNGRPSNVSLFFRVPSADCTASEPVTVRFSNCITRCHKQPTYSFDGGDSVPVLSEQNTNVMALCDNSEVCIRFDRHDHSYELFQTVPTNATVRQGQARLSPRGLKFHPDRNKVQKSCLTLFHGMHPQTSTRFANETNQVEHNDCMLTCSELRRKDMSLLQASDCGSSSRTFWTYMILRIIASIFMSCCFTLFDATTMFIVSRHNTDYGKQRIWPIFATAIFPPITGFLVDYYSNVGTTGMINYMPPFIMLDILMLSTTLMMLFGGIEIHNASTHETNFKTLRTLLSNPKVDALIVSLFLLGTLWGYIEIFLYWFLMEIGSPTYLLGLTLTVGSGFGIPVLFLSDKIINKFGNMNIMFAAFIFYAIRYLGYSIIYNPWWCLIFEAMEIFTFHLMWVSVVTYTYETVPEGLQATMQGVIGGTHYGFGRGSGSLVGGLLMGYIGARNTFRYMGIAAAVAGFIYLFVEAVVFRWLYKSKPNSNIELQKEKSTT